MPSGGGCKHGMLEIMCGRFTSLRRRQELIDLFDIDSDVDAAAAEELAVDYNVAPTKPVPVVLTRDVRELHVARWGLVPSWAQDVSIGAKLINARVETADVKPAFRRAFARHRCLVPADGWYEWAVVDGVKVPHYIHPAGGTLAMAGLYEVWRGPDTWLLSCTVITTEAIGELSGIHHRMPALVTPDRWAAWLDPALTEPDEVRSLLPPVPSGTLTATPVSTAVNKVINNGPDLVREWRQAGIEEKTTPTLF